MLNIEPLEVKLIDFNRVYLDSTLTKGSIRGTPGYIPERSNWEDGNVNWDIWAVAAIILESDVEIEAFINSNTEKDLKNIAAQYLK